MKTRIRDVRRRDMQRAAFDILAEEGFHGLTLAKVAERLGMSRGLLHHYFADKDELLEAAVRFGNRMISEDVAERLRQCRTPQERLGIIFAGNFDESIYLAERAKYWVSYCAQATFSHRFSRLIRIQNARMHSNLMHELKQLTDAAHAAEIAAIISMLMDGMWTRMGVTGNYPEKPAALALVNQTLAALLAQRAA
ncbi:transcriptional regulator BetI [Dongia sp.]|uniref:transcriptional regulator BetI n=1 Tax=Dongia sp. TaxID=1977262 RepID=UPI0035B2F5C5